MNAFYDSELDNHLRLIFENPKIITHTIQSTDLTSIFRPSTILRLNVFYSSFDLIRGNGWNEPLLAELISGNGFLVNKETSHAIAEYGINCTYELRMDNFEQFMSRVTELARKI
jgi:hypothetical protein